MSRNAERDCIEAVNQAEEWKEREKEEGARLAEPVAWQHRRLLSGGWGWWQQVGDGDDLAWWKACVAQEPEKYQLRALYPHPAPPTNDNAQLHYMAELRKNAELREALQKIADIEDEYFGGDWDEINNARELARRALEAK